VILFSVWSFLFHNYLFRSCNSVCEAWRLCLHYS